MIIYGDALAVATTAGSHTAEETMKSNLTTQGTQPILRLELECVSNFGTQNELILVAALNMFLSITAILGNILILVALKKDSSTHPSSKQLFRSLAASDLGVGLVAEPLFVAYNITLVYGHWNICRYTFGLCLTTAFLFCSVSLFTLTAISVDRLLALLLKLRYRQTVTLHRVHGVVLIFWIVSAVATTLFFWNYFITLWCGCAFITLCLTTSILSYTKIFVTLRHYQTQVQELVHHEEPSQTIPLNIAVYKKAVSSALWLQFTLIFCYVPYGISSAFWITNRMPSSVFIARKFTATLVFLNSSLNPILYYWKIIEVRQAVKATLRQLCFTSS